MMPRDTDAVRDLHLQALCSVSLHSLAPRVLYHVQHVFPEDGRQAAAKVDAAIRQAVASCVGDAVVEDDIARARLLLPARMYGGGIRSLGDVSPAAFIGALCRAVPEFLDRRREDFSVQPGFLPMLAPVLGHGSFDEGYPAPFQGLLATGTLTAAALQRHWAELQQEVGAEGRGAGAGALAGPLSMKVEAAGIGVAKSREGSHANASRRGWRASMRASARPRQRTCAAQRGSTSTATARCGSQRGQGGTAT